MDRSKLLSNRLLLFGIILLSLSSVTIAKEPQKGYITQQMRGWTVHVSDQLVKKDAKAVNIALLLLDDQLKKLVDSIPEIYVKKMKQVPIWFSPKYKDAVAGACYHPNVNWLKEHGRRKELVKCVEFTNIPIFKKEIKRMPVMVIHEMAHAYHDRELSFDQPEIIAAFRAAKKSKKYEKVKRNDGATIRAYAMTNHKEYFAESTEAFFGINDFYPFNKEELADYDPFMYRLLTKVWAKKTKNK